MAPPLTPEDFRTLTNVSRETLDRLTACLAVLTAWQGRLNLVGQKTLDDPWRRHFLDSAQLFEYLPPDTRILVDLGSGAGFPGLVLAVLGVPEVHLIESDRRKAAFLREAAHAAAVDVAMHAQRIEDVSPFHADVVTARALAPLPDLIGLAAPFLAQGATALFLKGRAADEELTAARRRWKMRVATQQSQSDPAGTILIIKDVAAHGPNSA